MFLGSIPLPIVLTTSLGGTESDVGITMSLCAALEIVIMGALIWKPLQRGERVAIVAGFATFIVYFVALTLVRSVGGVFWAQIPRAIGIAFVTYLGISFLHSLMPHRAGAAAALFSNAGQVGSVLAALSVGGLAKAFGYALHLWRMRRSQRRWSRTRLPDAGCARIASLPRRARTRQPSQRALRHALSRRDEAP